MTVRGIGIDVVDLHRFAEQLDLVGSRYRDAFTAGERELVRQPVGGDAQLREHEHLAARWAAKEAFIKAWASARHGATPHLDRIEPRDIEVRLDAWGRPGLRLHGNVAEGIRATLGPTALHVSLSHDGGTVVALVVIESIGTSVDGNVAA